MRLRRSPSAEGVRTLSVEHAGLVSRAMRASLRREANIVAFVDADAEADPDWLYHLVETLTRREAAAVGGPNFAPPIRIRIWPQRWPWRRDGRARCCRRRRTRTGVRMQHGARKVEDRRCAVFRSRCSVRRAMTWIFRGGCARMAETDRLRAGGSRDSSAHARRSAAYLRQQRGYGPAEGLLYRKYPRRAAMIRAECTAAMAGVVVRWRRASITARSAGDCSRHYIMVRRSATRLRRFR